jgi:hypothetical protein
MYNKCAVFYHLQNSTVTQALSMSNPAHEWDMIIEALNYLLILKYIQKTDV